MNRSAIRMPFFFYFPQHVMRIIYGLGTIEFISWRSVSATIGNLLAGEFTSDILLIGQ